MQRNKKDYDGETQRESVLKRPEVYVGSTHRNEKTYWVYHKEILKQETLDTPVAVMNIFNEILANAIDISSYSLAKGLVVNSVVVRMDEKTVKVTNEGTSIPIEKKKFIIEGTKEMEKMWIPQACFGRFNTSTNYKDRDGIGRNGLGGKCVNVLSEKFSIDFINSVTGQRYKQVWTNNMENVSEPKITDCEGDNQFTISYGLDFNLFNLKKYRKEEIVLYETACYCLLYTSPSPRDRS